MPIYRFDSLTIREKEIVGLLKIGKTAKEIAWDLGTSHHTITSHISNIRGKFECNNLLQLGLVLGGT